MVAAEKSEPETMAREGSKRGRPIGIPNKATIERAKKAELERLAAKAEGRKLPKEILFEYASLLAGIAAAFQPAKSPDGVPIWRNAEHEANFEKWVAIAFPWIKEAAPYYSPTLKAVEVKGSSDSPLEVVHRIERTIIDVVANDEDEGPLLGLNG
jgi:hypothetical protein